MDVLFACPHLARPARHFLDCDVLAGHRTVPGTRRRPARAPVPESRCQLAVRGIDSGRRGLDGRAGLRDSPAVGGRPELLVRAPGLRVRRSGPILADSVVCGFASLADPDAPLSPARPKEGAGCGPATVGCLRVVGRRHCPFLWRGSDVGERNEPGRGRVLALVGGAPVG